MDERVLKIIEEEKQKSRKIEQEKKNNILISHGLYEKVYAPSARKQNENGEWYYEEVDYTGYDFCEIIDDEQVYYKKVPIEISDEDYQELLNNICVEDEGEHEETIRKYEKAYKTFKIIPNVVLWEMIILGFIIGVLCASIDSDVGFLIYLFCQAVGVVLGLFCKWLCRITMSYLIMQTEYLAVITEKLKKISK